MQSVIKNRDSKNDGKTTSASGFSKILEMKVNEASTRTEAEKTKIDLQQKMLGVRAYRQQLIASNIANADTPGYKSVDVDIAEIANQLAMNSLSMKTSAQGHLSGVEDKSQIFRLKYQIPYQSSVDGNTVEMDIERQKYADNSLMYQFSLDRVGGEFRDMKELFSSIK